MVKMPTIAKLYEMMKAMPKDEMLSLDLDQRQAFKELFEYLKTDFEKN